MKLYDPARRYVNDRPVLIGNFAHIVPNLCALPERDLDKTRLIAMIPSGTRKFESRQVSRIIDTSDLAKVLDAYRDDPENTLETLFNISLIALEPSSEDLARSIRKDYSSTSSKRSYTNIGSLDDQIASIEL
jgi:hypothetical protein